MPYSEYKLPKLHANGNQAQQAPITRCRHVYADHNAMYNRSPIT